MIESKAFVYRFVRYLSCFLLRLYHAVDTDNDEGDGENLAHIYWQRRLKGFLDLLGVLYEEAEGEDVSQTEAKVPTGAHL